MTTINRQIFDKYGSKYKDEKKEIAKILASFGNQVSNFDKAFNSVLSYAGKLNTMWDAGNYLQKQQLQFLVFPDGMYYNRKKDECRTERVNSVFLSIAKLARTTGEIKDGNRGGNSNVAVSVAGTVLNSNQLFKDLKEIGDF